MRQPPFLALAAASLLLTLACGDQSLRANAGASCTEGAACAEGHACFENVCRPQQGVVCDDTRARCVTGLVCEGGLCVGDAGNECDDGHLCASALACADGRCAAGAAGRCGGAGEITCQQGLVCEEATCHVAVGGACGTVERICASGLLCEDGRCRASAGRWCGSSEDCVSGHVCHEGACLGVPGTACTPEAPCAPGGVCRDGHCAARAGGACSAAIACDTGLACADGLCLGAVGHACTQTTECGPELTCEALTCLVALGGACGGTERPCASGLQCEDGACRASPGHDCAGSEECVAGYLCHDHACEGVPGSACAPAAPCAPGGLCEVGICVAVAGGACSPTVACASGLVCAGGVCRGETGHACVASGDCAPDLLCENRVCRAVPGDACAVAGDCVAGSVCVAPRCVLPPGAACATDPECRDGYACEDGSCRPLAGSPCSPALPCLSSDFCDAGVCTANLCLTSLETPLTPSTVVQPALVCSGTATSVAFSGEDCDSLSLNLSREATVIVRHPSVKGNGTQASPVLDTEGNYSWTFTAKRTGCPSVSASRPFVVRRPQAPVLSGPATTCEATTAALSVAGGVATAMSAGLAGPSGFSQSFASVTGGQTLTSAALASPGLYTWTVSAKVDGCADATATHTVEVKAIGSVDCPLTLPSASLTPQTSADFGTVIIGSSAERTFVYANTSATYPLQRGVISVSDPLFAIGAASTCLSAPALMPLGASCTVVVTFQPAAAAAASATLSITSNAFRAPHTAALTATGASPIALLEVSPTSLDFGSVGIATGPTASFTLRNKGSSSSLISVGTPSAAVFTKSASTCMTTLGAGATCKVTIRFNPTAVVPSAATIPVTFGSLNETVSVALRGSGMAPPPTTTIPTIELFHNYSSNAVADPYLPFSLAGLVTLDNTSDGNIFNLGDAYTGSCGPYQHSIGVALGKLCTHSGYGLATSVPGQTTLMRCDTDLGPVVVGQQFHLAAEAYDATHYRVAVNGHFVATVTTSLNLTGCSLMKSLGTAWGSGMSTKNVTPPYGPYATSHPLAGRVADMKYWNNKLIWGGVDFDPADF